MRRRHKTRYPGIYFRLVDETKPDGPRRYIVWYSDANGDGHTQTLPEGATLEDARLLQGSLQARKADGETLVRTRKTVGELLDEWLELRRSDLKPKTVEDYEGAISRLKREFGKRRATELSPSDVARLISKMKRDGLKTETVKKTMIPLSGAYALAVREGWVGSSPVTRLLPTEKPKGDSRAMRCLAREEIPRLLDAAPTEKWRTLFSFLIHTGLRISEALALTWDDVLEDRVIVRGGKTKAAAREVMLIPAVRARLVELRLSQKPGEELVFGLRDRRTALRTLRKVTVKAGIPDYTLHELRHTFASILISQGENVVLVSKQMGHADPSITLKRYAHLFDAQASVDAARDRLQATMGGMA